MRQTLEGSFKLRGGDFSAAGAPSKELRDRLAVLGVDAETIRRVAVAVFEAEMNVIIHAVAGTLHYVLQGEELKVRVTDMGPGIADIELAMKEGYSTAPEWARELGWGTGMGLPNIKANTDTLKIDSQVGEGTTVEFTIKLRREAP
jgi:anti-sigma regulatory factor (Ser/Thr protein kinase)